MKSTLAQFGSDSRSAVSSYERFVASGIATDAPRPHAQIFLRGDRFIASIADRLRGQVLDVEIPAEQRRPHRPSLEGVRAAVAAEWKLPPEALDRRRAGEAKVAAIYIATKLCGLTAREVGEAFGVRRGRVSNIVSLVQRGRVDDLRQRISTVIGVLRSETLGKELPGLELEPKW